MLTVDKVGMCINHVNRCFITVSALLCKHVTKSALAQYKCWLVNGTSMKSFEKTCPSQTLYCSTKKRITSVAKIGVTHTYQPFIKTLSFSSFGVGKWVC